MNENFNNYNQSNFNIQNNNDMIVNQNMSSQNSTMFQFQPGINTNVIPSQGAQNDYEQKIKKLKNRVRILLITNIITLAILIAAIFVLVSSPKTKNAPKADNTTKEVYPTTATNNPVSNDWKDYQFSINGKTLSLPCSYKELKSISNFHMKSSDEKSYIEHNKSTYVNLYKSFDDQEKLALYIDIKNDTSGDLAYADCKVVRVCQTLFEVETNKAEVITFPHNLKVGMEISKEEIIDLLGEPQKISEYTSGNYTTVTLKYHDDPTYTSINYYEIKIRNGKIDELGLDHKKYNE